MGCCYKLNIPIPNLYECEFFLEDEDIGFKHDEYGKDAVRQIAKNYLFIKQIIKNNNHVTIQSNNKRRTSGG